MTRLCTISRRSFLMGSGALLALPCLESLVDAGEPSRSGNPVDPVRMVFMGVGYGFTNESFYPTKPGKWADIGLPEGMSPLRAHQSDITMVGNLASGKASDPHFGSTNFLTGVDTIGVPGKNFYNAISCDQVAAETLGKDTRYPSLRLSPSSLYENNGHGRGLSLSWDRAGNPLPGINSPLALYRALFANKVENLDAAKRRLEERKSILDLMELDGKAVNRQLGTDDQSKLDEYFQSVRQAELALDQESSWLDRPKPNAPFEYSESPSGDKEIRLAYQLIALALQTDATRVVTYMMPNKSLLQSIGHPYEPHGVSHYGVGPNYKEASQARERKHCDLLASFLASLKEKKDAQGRRLFDTTLISFGSTLRWGHVMKSLPLILAGGAAKRLKRGEYVLLPKESTPLSNVWLTLLKEVGVKAETFGQSTGIVPEMLTSA
jgi:hypothetical protein